ncbi:MAG: tetratricopeptide repeat protein [Glycocaulis sp.]
MVDVFDEVEEELRKERYMQLLRKWGPWVAGAAFIVIAGVAGHESWRAFERHQAETASTRFAEARALDLAGDSEAAREAYGALVADGPRGYATLALLHDAALASAAGNTDEATRLYEQAAQRSPVALIRDLARYQAALAGFDTLSSDDIRLRLDPLISGGSSFALLARELVGAAALRDERWEEARRQYEFIQLSIDASEGLRTRARDALSAIARSAPAEIAEEVLPEPDQTVSEPEAALDDALPLPEEESGQ